MRELIDTIANLLVVALSVAAAVLAFLLYDLFLGSKLLDF